MRMTVRIARIGPSDPERVAVKIARQIFGCGNQSCEWDSLPLVPALVVNEEEGLVFPDGPAQRSAVLVQIEFLALGGEITAGIERSIAEELEQGTMELVRSRFRGDQHGRARTGAVLSRVVVGQNLEFLDGVNRRQNRNAAGGEFVVVVPIEQPVRALGARSADRKGIGTAGGDLAAGTAIEETIRVGFLGDARSQRRQLDEVPSIQRQLGHLL